MMEENNRAKMRYYNGLKELLTKKMTENKENCLTLHVKTFQK